MIRSSISLSKTNEEDQTIYEDDYFVSSLIEKKWLHKLIGTWGKKKYIFKFTVRLHTTINILTDEYKKVGSIRVNLLGNKAVIKIHDKTYYWYSKNLINKQWLIKNQEEENIINSDGQFFTNNLPINHRGILNLSGHAIQHFDNHYIYGFVASAFILLGTLQQLF
ncbi:MULTISPECIES: hypothetical protein [Flammeovirga]|uniref:Uncharacterized protein n=1 Tax=Flammeovirga agarivorans TaxID=2726742 RepID=A0A7X8SP24_9BACT|nr:MULTISPECIES: hypothetical protein [Flammeovirga]NLR93698.1 hypothetical protein [Flammeovirga agarivorans]